MSRASDAPPVQRMQRAICPVCQKPVPTRKGGFLRWHGDGNPMTSEFKECPGTGGYGEPA